MFDAKKFLYSETKLGNVLLTYEHQRRLGSYGVQVCLLSNTAVTFAHLQWPTGVSTNTALLSYITALLSTKSVLLSAAGPRSAALLRGNSHLPQNRPHPHSTVCITLHIAPI